MIALDATLRDGGYYNDWNFDIRVANEYLIAIEKSKMDAIEVGFRSLPDKKSGPFSKVTDYFIEKHLHIPNIKYFGVMINESDYDYPKVNKFFFKCEDSPINLVRVATHFNRVSHAKDILKSLKSLGYTVCINLMQAADKSYDEIRDAAKLINEWKCVDVIYLADSLGGMTHDTVNYAFQAISEGWKGPMGFHGHNNKGLALDNTLEAVDMGVEWIDSTIMGMGRGPGNTETEYMLNELNKRNFEFELEPIYELAMSYFYDLKKECNWGPSLPYYLSAEYNIHPTYIQSMINKYTITTVLKAINYLKNKKANSFNQKLFLEAIKGD